MPRRKYNRKDHSDLTVPIDSEAPVTESVYIPRAVKGHSGFLPLNPDRTKYDELVRIVRAAPDPAALRPTVEAHGWRYISFVARCKRATDDHERKHGVKYNSWKQWLYGSSGMTAPTAEAEESTAMLIKDTLLVLLKEMRTPSRLAAATAKDIAYMYQVLATQHPDVLFAPASDLAANRVGGAGADTAAGAALLSSHIDELYRSVPKSKTVRVKDLSPAVRKVVAGGQ